jgi:hypothetical protein
MVKVLHEDRDRFKTIPGPCCEMIHDAGLASSPRRRQNHMLSVYGLPKLINEIVPKPEIFWFHR